MTYDNSGYKYLKTGDETGDLCIVCDRPMFIDKYDGCWTIRCRCGREVPFISNAKHDSYAQSVYK